MELIIIGMLIVSILICATFFSKGKPRKSKFIVWGLTIMLGLAPLLSWIISISYTMVDDNPWTGILLLLILFPTIFLIGFILLLIGIFLRQNKMKETIKM
ncbi:hypothetical protein [Metabacillus malikii]|uniref:Uncharacterized protein n=1 Tax=Metabacillus malikii TaxID=1504265 RepID=A0ABT9ZJS1_9BACI|nr:hypothetical protein [Metabacillus malikii]MDQ0232542.1 hypothetical protein [Metabacillus malikii]